MIELRCDNLVIGSGPGGATTTAMLAEAGHDVLMVEEGSDHTVDSAPNYSLAEMDQKYRNGGLTTTFGKTNVTYIEGRCVGGASEINAALYHRPHAETLDRWGRDNHIDGFRSSALWTWFEQVEQVMGVTRKPTGLSPASNTLAAGADKLGWKSREIERFWRYDEGEQSWEGKRQSMSTTLVPRALAKGARLRPDTRILRLHGKGRQLRWAEGTTLHRGRRVPVRVVFGQLFLCCGAVQTPTLLRRSGITEDVGDNLRLHPMVRIAARFPFEVNDPRYGVPVRQVEQFKPTITLGCSHSSPPHIALWLGNQVEDKRQKLEQWKKIAVFYTAVQGEASGRIRALPWIHEPLVTYPLTDADQKNLGEGLYRLAELCFAGGAAEIFHPIEGQPSIRHPRELADLRDGLPHGAINVTTIHLFSSLPMGERRGCAVDSYGALRAFDNVQVHDASVLPTSPGVNPQGTIMALVRRSTAAWLARQ